MVNMKRIIIIKILLSLLIWAMFVGVVIEESDFLKIIDNTLVLEYGGLIQTGSRILDGILRISCWGIAIVSGFHVLEMFDRYNLNNK